MIFDVTLWHTVQIWWDLPLWEIKLSGDTINIDLNLVNWDNWVSDDAIMIHFQENADLLVSLRGAIFFDSKKKGVDQVLISMGIGENNNNTIISQFDATKRLGWKILKTSQYAWQLPKSTPHTTQFIVG